MAFLLVKDFTHMALACAMEPLRVANLISGRSLYRWRLLSPGGIEAQASSGIRLKVDGGFLPNPLGSTLFVISGLNVEQRVDKSLLTYLRRERARGVRMGALCSGAYIFAKGGFLDGHRAAIHWAFHDSFKDEFPNVELSPCVFVVDDSFITASGGTATADLVLHLIAQDHGRDFAASVADQLVYNGVRPQDADQRLSLQSRMGFRNARIRDAIALMSEYLDGPVSTPQIAQPLGITARQLERLFQRYLACSPKRYLLKLRLTKARNLLMQTEKSITEIAVCCGFSSPSHFSRVFRQNLGYSPSEQRLEPRGSRTSAVEPRTAAQPSMV